MLLDLYHIIHSQKLFVKSSQTQCLLKLRFQFQEFKWQTLSSYYVQHELSERYTVNSSKSAKARKFKHTIIGHGASVTIFPTLIYALSAPNAVLVASSLKEQYSFSQKNYLCFYTFRRKIFSEIFFQNVVQNQCSSRIWSIFHLRYNTTFRKVLS